MNKTFTQYLQDSGLSENTIRVYTCVIKRIIRDNKKGKLPVTETITRYLNKRTVKGRAYYTRYAIKHYYNFIGKPELIKYLPKPRISEPETLKSTYIDRKQVIQILKELKTLSNKKWWVIATIQAYCGTRPAETIKLNKRNISKRKDGSIYIRIYGKGRRARPLVLHNPLSHIVLEFVRRRGAYPFLVQTFKNIESKKALKQIQAEYHTYYMHVKNAAASVGVPTFTPHDFRRNVAEDLRRKGYDINTIQAVLGHKNQATTLIYFRRDVEDVAKALKKLY